VQKSNPWDGSKHIFWLSKFVPVSASGIYTKTSTKLAMGTTDSEIRFGNIMIQLVDDKGLLSQLRSWLK